jgi:hypothetical protein
MNSIYVQAGDTVTKWQQIWEVGNTGNTYWALGGYHVHFEIDKNNGWRPAYAFSGCPELDKWHSEIIKNGYCRIQLFQYTKDPIAMLESVDAPYPGQAWETKENKPKNDNEDIHGVATGNVVETGNTNVSTWEKVVLPGEKKIKDKPLNVEKKNLIDLNFDWLDVNGKEFVNKWNIEIEKGFDDSIMLEQATQITIRITNKVSWAKYNGALNIPITAIASNTNVSLNPVSVMLVQDGEAKITITPVKMWNTYIALNLGNAKIGGTTIAIK